MRYSQCLAITRLATMPRGGILPAKRLVPRLCPRRRHPKGTIGHHFNRASFILMSVRSSFPCSAWGRSSAALRPKLSERRNSMRNGKGRGASEDRDHAEHGNEELKCMLFKDDSHLRPQFRDHTPVYCATFLRLRSTTNLTLFRSNAFINTPTPFLAASWRSSGYRGKSR